MASKKRVASSRIGRLGHSNLFTCFWSTARCVVGLPALMYCVLPAWRDGAIPNWTTLYCACAVAAAHSDGRYQHIQNRYNTKYLTTWYRYYRYRNDTISDVGGTTNHILNNQQVKQPKCMRYQTTNTYEWSGYQRVRGQTSYEHVWEVKSQQV